MRCVRKTFLPLFLLVALGMSCPGYSSIIPRYDLKTLCYLSSDIVEATLVRHHRPGTENWSDTFSAAVTDCLEGQCKPGDQILSLDLEIYTPAQTGQHCILFLAPSGFPFQRPVKAAPLQVVDMLLVDHSHRIYHYVQYDNPGGLQADNHTLQHSQTLLVEERIAILTDWASAKKLKTPPLGTPYPYLRH